MKKCTECSRIQEDKSFRVRTNKKVSPPKTYLNSTCKTCEASSAKSHRKNKPESVAVAIRKYSLKRKYNLTLAEYEEKLQQQKGLCAICGTTTPGNNGGMIIDHDHRTGSVRSLLCNACNVGLGTFKDNSDLLRRAADYLDGWSKG